MLTIVSRRSWQRLRWPWLWIAAAVLAACQFAAAVAGNWELVLYLAVPVASMWMGCCCDGGCSSCCSDRNPDSESVEARIVGVDGEDGPFNCSLDCNDTFGGWTGLVTSNSEYFDGTCLWDNGVSGTSPVACGSPGSVGTPGFVFNTVAGFTIGFAQKRLECTGSIIATPGECWLTAIVTGDSTTSGVENSGPFTVLFEKKVLGPYPAICEGLHTLAYKCGTGFVACDWTNAHVELNFVF